MNGDDVSEADAFRSMVNLAQAIAIALQDESLRIRVYGALHASPFPEHKIHLRPFTQQGVGADLLAAAANGTGRTIDGMRAIRDSAIDLEFYMPVKTHFASWTGDANLLVVTSYDADNDLPVGFNLRGERVVLSSARIPPPTPALVLVHREADFMPAGPQAVWEYGVGPGVYMTYAQIYEDYEGWPNGDPEFEVRAGWRLEGDTVISLNRCAGEGASGGYQYNQDDQTWSGLALLVDSTSAAGAATVDSAMIFTVWEDDNTPCVVVMGTANLPTNYYLSTFPSPRAWRNRWDEMFADPLVTWFSRTGMKLINAILDTPSDEYVGLMVDLAVVGASWTDANMAIITPDTTLTGRAMLVRYGSPPAPLSVSITGPSVVGPNNYSCGQWLAYVPGGASPFQYSWTGLFTSSAHYVEGVIPQTGGTIYLFVEDDEGAIGSSSIVVTYDSNNTDWCI